jgi:hypothetical protein
MPVRAEWKSVILIWLECKNEKRMDKNDVERSEKNKPAIAGLI